MNDIITSDKKYISIYRLDKQQIESIADPRYWDTISEDDIYNELLDSATEHLLKHTKDKNASYLRDSLDTIMDNCVSFNDVQRYKPFTCSKYVSYDIIEDITSHLEDVHEFLYI